MLNLSSTLLLLINFANIAIGTWVLLKNPRRIVNRSFFIFVLGSSAWAMGILLIYITHDFYFDKLALGGGLLMMFGITLFARVFPTEERVQKRFFLLYIPLAMVATCLPFNVFITGITIDTEGLVRPANGPLLPLYVAVVVAYSLAALYYFKRSYVKATGNSQLQMLYFTAGIGIFMLSLIVCDGILPAVGVYQFNLLGPATSLVFVLMTSYAVVRHQLMDIRVAIQRSAAYSVIISLIVGIYICLLSVADYVSDSAGWIAVPVSAAIVTFIAVITVPRFERYFQRVTNRFFFKDPYDYAAALEKLSTVLNENIEFSKLFIELFTTLDEILHPETILYTNVITNLTYGAQGNIWEINSPDMPAGGTVIAIRMQNKTIGKFTFGGKRSGESYTSQDLSLLRTFAEQAAVAFEKAAYYQELKTYSESLEQMVQERTKNITELQSHQRQFFDDISHALQTPITVLKGAVELIRAEYESADIRTLEAMEYSIDGVSQIITEILELARLDAIPIPEQAELLNLSRVAEDVTEYVEVVCRQNNICVRTQIAPDIFIMGNRKQVEEAITNLLSNAVRYTTSCETREILVTLAYAQEFTELRVKDSGIGIAPERLSDVFGRFYRGNERETSSSGGHGLGLAIVKRIMERHGGTAHAESALGTGTTMILRFPLEAAERIPETRA